MTREEILRNAEALVETVPDEKVRGLVRQAYIKGAEDNAVGDSETFAEHYGCVPEPENEKGTIYPLANPCICDENLYILDND